MRLSLIISGASALVASAFAADAAYSLYNGAAINAPSILMDIAGVCVFGLTSLLALAYEYVYNNTGIPYIRPTNVCPTCKKDPCECGDIYRTIDAVRLLMTHDCITPQHKSILGDIVKCILTEGNESCEA